MNSEDGEMLLILVVAITLAVVFIPILTLIALRAVFHLDVEITFVTWCATTFLLTLFMFLRL